ncbi:hypothetical protein ANANG_G00296050, partial [Anguilla anguilla]
KRTSVTSTAEPTRKAVQRLRSFPGRLKHARWLAPDFEGEGICFATPRVWRAPWAFDVTQNPLTTSPAVPVTDARTSNDINVTIGAGRGTGPTPPACFCTSAVLCAFKYSVACVQCSVLCVQYTEPGVQALGALKPVPCVLWSVSLCPVLCALCSVPCALCSVLCAVFSVSCA